MLPAGREMRTSAPPSAGRNTDSSVTKAWTGNDPDRCSTSRRISVTRDSSPWLSMARWASVKTVPPRMNASRRRTSPKPSRARPVRSRVMTFEPPHSTSRSGHQVAARGRASMRSSARGVSVRLTQRNRPPATISPIPKAVPHPRPERAGSPADPEPVMKGAVADRPPAPNRSRGFETPTARRRRSG